MNIFKRKVIIVLPLVLASVLFANSLSLADQAGGSGNLFLIFDASGSMWGQIDGKAKITIAREAMSDIIKSLPDDINVGLTIYGHRKKGDCNDVETVIPLGRIDKKVLQSSIETITPKGKTPIVRSVRMTADAIKQIEDEVTILLVSDGKETCDPDPCNFVKKLKDLGIHFVMHVVGFDVGGETEAELKCMAEAGGGEYFSASDADNLKKALDTVIDKTVEKNLKVSGFLNGKPIAVHVEILDSETGKILFVKDSTEKQSAVFGLDAGVYDVKVTDEWIQESKPHQMFSKVEVTDTQVREIVANFGGGVLEVRPLKNGKPFAAAVKVTDASGKEYRQESSDKHPAKFNLVPGKYSVRVIDAWGTKSQVDINDISIEQGKTVKKKALFGSGTLLVRPLKNGKPFDAMVAVYDSEGKDQQSQSTESDPARFELNAGTYTVKVRDAWGTKNMLDLGEVVVETGKTVKKQAVFDSGTLLVRPLKNGKPFDAMVAVYDSEGKDRQNQSTESEPARFELNAGTYTVKVRDAWGTKMKLDLGEVVVEPGKTIKKQAIFGSGTLIVRPLKNGKPFDAMVAVYDSEGKDRQNQSTESEPARFELNAGTYTVKVRDAWGTKNMLDLGEVAVETGKIVKKQAVFSSGILLVRPLKNGKPFDAMVEVYDSEGKDRQNQSTESEPARFELNAGTYRVKVRDAWGTKTNLDLGEVVIENGKTVQKKVDFDRPQTSMGTDTSDQLEKTAKTGDSVDSDTDTILDTDAVKAQAVAAQADAMNQMKAAMEQLKKAGIVPPDSTNQQSDDTGDSEIKVAGAQPGVQVGVQPGVADKTRIEDKVVGAVDTGGGLDDEINEQGRNPYAGMTKEQMQAAFAKDVGIKSPQRKERTGFNAEQWKLGRAYPLSARRHSNTLGRRLNSYEQKAREQNRSDILARIETARGSITAFNKQIKKRVPKETLQDSLNKLAQEVDAIRISLAMQ